MWDTRAFLVFLVFLITWVVQALSYKMCDARGCFDWTVDSSNDACVFEVYPDGLTARRINKSRGNRPKTVSRFEPVDRLLSMKAWKLKG